MNKLICYLTIFFLLYTSQMAMAFLPGNGYQNFILEADGGVEWLSNQKIYYAKKNVVVTLDAVKIHCNELKAFYKEDENRNNQIVKIIAEGFVRILSKDQMLRGERLVYDFETGLVRLTGNTLKLEQKDRTIYAKESFVLDRQKFTVKALGNVIIREDDRRLQAEEVKVQYSSKEFKEINEIFFSKNVTVKDKEGYISGNHAFYKVETGDVKFIGKTKILRGRHFVTSHGLQYNDNKKTIISSADEKPTIGLIEKGNVND